MEAPTASTPKLNLENVFMFPSMALPGLVTPTFPKFKRSRFKPSPLKDVYKGTPQFSEPVR
ncbi:hypothetical protein D3C80_1773100 [compost metagenome]